MDTGEKLKPCPWCNSRAVTIRTRNGEYLGICTTGRVCPGNMFDASRQGFMHEKDAITAWNTRAPDPLVEKLQGDLQQARTLVERLKLEAACWAAEAKTHRSSVHEIYQALSGSRGEPGDWNGAIPAREAAAIIEKMGRGFA